MPTKCASKMSDGTTVVVQRNGCNVGAFGTTLRTFHPYIIMEQPTEIFGGVPHRPRATLKWFSVRDFFSGAM